MWEIKFQERSSKNHVIHKVNFMVITKVKRLMLPNILQSEQELHIWNPCRIDDFRGACAFKGNGAVAGHVKRVDHDDVFDALLFREETLTHHYFKLKFDFSWGIRTNMGKTEGIFLNLQCNCHIVGSIIIKLIIHRTISVHGCQIWQR